MSTRAVEVALRPLDRVRWGAYAALGSSLGRLLADPLRRTWWLAWVYAVLAFVATVAFPLGLLALGPIVWGIPHVLSDVRYLVLARGYHRDGMRLLAIGLALLSIPFGAGLLGGAVAVLVAALTTRGSLVRRACVVAAACALGGLHYFARHPAELAFAHLHNWIAVAWLCVLFRDAKRSVALALGLVAFTGLLLWMPLSWIGFDAWVPEQLGVGYHASVLAPWAESPLAARVVLSFAFAQAFHYAVWVRLVPELMRERSAPRSFTASYRALGRDFGQGTMLIVLVSMAALALGALYALRDARETYLAFALFHAYLELAFGAVWWISASKLAATTPYARTPSVASEVA